MRVLVIEDARPLADVVAEGLRDQGMATDIARDGLEAAAKLDLNAYDVVVLDRDLPGIHGDALCQMITSRDERVMVLMLTAAGAPQDRVSGLSMGADDYLAKPFHFPELVLRIRALARRQPAARARILRKAGIELDPAARTAIRDGRSLDLSVKEFAVLEALLHASPAFLSAEDLLEKAWDENADPFTNTVTVTIGRLRRKLGDPPVITTTPGVGYRIASDPAPGSLGSVAELRHTSMACPGRFGAGLAGHSGRSARQARIPPRLPTTWLPQPCGQNDMVVATMWLAEAGLETDTGMRVTLASVASPAHDSRSAIARRPGRQSASIKSGYIMTLSDKGKHS